MWNTVSCKGVWIAVRPPELFGIDFGVVELEIRVRIADDLFGIKPGMLGIGDGPKLGLLFRVRLDWFGSRAELPMVTLLFKSIWSLRAAFVF